MGAYFFIYIVHSSFLNMETAAVIFFVLLNIDTNGHDGLSSSSLDN